MIALVNCFIWWVLLLYCHHPWQLKCVLKIQMSVPQLLSSKIIILTTGRLREGIKVYEYILTNYFIWYFLIIHCHHPWLLQSVLKIQISIPQLVSLKVNILTTSKPKEEIKVYEYIYWLTASYDIFKCSTVTTLDS